MSIQKITAEEIMTLGVKSLPTRPNAPSLYGGKPLSAEELKEAFDRLPTLIAERFNALLSATGLFLDDRVEPYESFAELIATHLSESHSLADFFDDVENGTLSSYLTLPDGASLADVISFLREELSLLRNCNTVVVGDGDLLTDATVENGTLTLRKDTTIKSILDKAKTYAETPRGAVAPRSKLPVSGKAVYDAISSITADLDPENLSARISVLEKAAADTVYSYPDTDTVRPYFRMQADVLSHAILSRLGGALYHDKNFFPEKILTTHTGSNLSFTWDASANCLVLNGTLTPSEGLVPLAVFRELASEFLYSTALYYRGGTIEGLTEGGTKFVFSTEDADPLEIPLQMADHIGHNLPYFEVLGRFASVSIQTKSAVTFRDFRFNLLLRGGYAPTLSYVPYEGQAIQMSIPKAICIHGANEWQESSTLEFGGSLEIPFDFSSPCYNITISCHVETDDPSLRLIHVEGYTAEGKIDAKRFVLGSPSSINLYSETSPITGIRFFINGADENYSFRTTLRNLQIERGNMNEFSATYPYTAPFDHTFSLPASLARFQNDFFGFDADNCNHFDFSQGIFVKNVGKFPLDGSYDWQADATVPGRYRTPFTPPNAGPSMGTKKNFCPSSLFEATKNADMPDESIRCTDTEIILQSSLFSSAAAVKAFFTIHPIDIIYPQTRNIEYLTEEEITATENYIIPAAPGAYVYTPNEEDELSTVLLRIKYQTKLQKEATE